MDEESGSNELEKAKLTKKVTENPNSQELLLRCEEGQAPSLAQTAKVITDDVIRASLGNRVDSVSAKTRAFNE